MIKLVFKILLFVIILQGCKQKNHILNQFSSSSDTIVIKTQKKKGAGLFISSSFPLTFKDTSEKFDYAIICPKNINNIKRIQKIVGIHDSISYFINIIKGNIGGKEIFVVDENNNRDLRDDSIRISKEIKWYASEDIIKCNYSTHNGREKVNDHSWIQIRKVGNELWMSRKDYLEGDFNIDDENYKIGVIDIRNSLFTYNIHPEIALLSTNHLKKDTLLYKEVLKFNEYLKLKNGYYHFAKVSKLGKQITLIKEPEFKRKIGTQLGMIAPDFKTVSISGDTINSIILNNKVTLIANVCGCGGDKKSTKAYYDIVNYYSNKINVIALDSKIDKNTEGTFVDVDEVFNRDIYNKYRQTYCSRMCYVIGGNNRIIDKFEVTEWKSNLIKLLD